MRTTASAAAYRMAQSHAGGGSSNMAQNHAEGSAKDKSHGNGKMPHSFVEGVKDGVWQPRRPQSAPDHRSSPRPPPMPAEKRKAASMAGPLNIRSRRSRSRS